MMAEGGGFEPTNELPHCWFSRPVLSTAQPPFLLELTFDLNIFFRCFKQQESFKKH